MTQHYTCITQHGVGQVLSNDKVHHVPNLTCITQHWMAKGGGGLAAV